MFVCPATTAEQSPATEGARVGSSELVNSESREASPVAKAPKEVEGQRSGQTERGAELLMEHPTATTAIEVPSDEEVKATAPLLLLKRNSSPCLGSKR